MTYLKNNKIESRVKSRMLALTPTPKVDLSISNRSLRCGKWASNPGVPGMATVLCFIAVISVFVSGCTIIKTREEVKYAENATVLAGTVSSTLSLSDDPIIVVAYSKKNGKRAIIHYTALHELGPYELMVTPGTHNNVVAFIDKNKNLTYDQGEPAGQILNLEQDSVAPGGVTGNMDIVISEHSSKKCDFPIGSKVPPKKYNSFHSTCPGALANIEDDLFSDEHGRKGFWTGVEFFKEFGGNIYFLEPYDQDKIPILFVHGAAGAPQNWRHIIEQIDRTIFQPWVFYYPSGSSIDSMSYLLFWKLQNLQLKYKFKELYITAHSMGGLVVRSFMVNYGHYFPNITNFISISTPWGGEKLAEAGVKYFPVVIPAWRDMQPGSEFISSIFRKNMPPTMDHYLFFGHKGNRNILRPNNDKVVTLASQLDQRSQKDAKMVYGFNEDHVSILSSEQVISHYNTLLADIYQKTKATDNVLGYRLHVDFSFDFSDELPRPTIALFLRPVDNKGAETWIILNSNDTGQDHGPFPAGDYEVSMIAPAFAPEPAIQSVRIREGAVPRVEFSMKPQGFLRGYVVRTKPDFTYVGKYRQRDTAVQIQSLTLKGKGIYRTLIPLEGAVRESGNFDPLVPLQEEEVGYSKYYLSATDFSLNGIFCFFDLPGGEYELTLNAKGYELYSEKYNVKPGEYQNTLLIELQRENNKP